MNGINAAEILHVIFMKPTALPLIFVSKISDVKGNISKNATQQENFNILTQAINKFKFKIAKCTIQIIAAIIATTQ